MEPWKGSANALRYVTKSSSSTWSDNSDHTAKQGSYSSDSYDYVGAIKFGNPNVLDTDWSNFNITQIELTPTYGDAGFHDRTKNLYLYGAKRTDIGASTGASLIGDYIGVVNSGCVVKEDASKTIVFSNSSNSEAFSNFVNYLQSGDSNVLVLYVKESLASGSNYSQNYLSITKCELKITYTEKTTTPPTTPLGNISGSFGIGTVNSYYQSSITCSGATGWSLYGSLPPGLSIGYSGETCTIYGTPSVAGTYSVSITAYNESESTGREMSITIQSVSYTITASAGAGGTISPIGSISVNSGDSQTFTISPDPGFIINYIKIDGVAQEANSTYTFSNITKNHTIEAYFLATYKITSSAGEGGSIEPNGVTTVQAGNSQSYQIKANEGYEILKLVIDGIEQGPHTDYTFSGVNKNHTIEAYFEALNYMYIGVENKAKIVENFYLGIDGFAREIIEGYIGINGIAKQFYRKIN